MLIKKKSLIVVLVSSFVICLVLVVNLAGYLIYLKLKDDEHNGIYMVELEKCNAKVYAKHIEIARLVATFDRIGPLSGQAVLEGILRNDGVRDLADVCIRVRFLDNDAAALYEVVFHPQEPSLGSFGSIHKVSVTGMADVYPSSIKPESSLAFKKILANCPREILSELKNSASPSGGKGRWAGRLDYDILSVNFK